jgi:hypothetical protein
MEPYSNLQQELLNIYSSNIEEQDLINIKKYLAEYFTNKATSVKEDEWQDRSYSFETMKQWLSEDYVRYEI